jgi:hypothetical protein
MMICRGSRDEGEESDDDGGGNCFHGFFSWIEFGFIVAHWGLQQGLRWIAGSGFKKVESFFFAVQQASSKKREARLRVKVDGVRLWEMKATGIIETLLKACLLGVFGSNLLQGSRAILSGSSDQRLFRK